MNPYDIVVMVRARYPAQSSPEIAAKIVNEAAWEMNGRTVEGVWGTHYKPSGQHYERTAIDIVENTNGALFDALRDAEGVADPQWYQVGGAPAWQPVRLDWLSGSPEPPEPPVPPPSDLEARVTRIEQTLADLADVLQEW